VSCQELYELSGNNVNQIDFNLIISAATDMFGGRRDWAMEWLKTPSPGLNGLSPRDAVQAGRRDEVLALIRHSQDDDPEDGYALHSDF